MEGMINKEIVKDIVSFDVGYAKGVKACNDFYQKRLREIYESKDIEKLASLLNDE